MTNNCDHAIGAGEHNTSKVFTPPIPPPPPKKTLVLVFVSSRKNPPITQKVSNNDNNNNVCFLLLLLYVQANHVFLSVLQIKKVYCYVIFIPCSMQILKTKRSTRLAAIK